MNCEHVYMCIHAFGSLDTFCFVPPDIQQVTPQPASPSPISASEHVRILLYVTHLVIVCEREH